MSGKYILNDQGEPVPCDDVIVWAQQFERADRRVALDEIGDSKVSTVFLGLDHNFGSGPPLLFETMIFGGPHADSSDRYSTREEALIGHAKAVAMVKADTDQAARM